MRWRMEDAGRIARRAVARGACFGGAGSRRAPPAAAPRRAASRGRRSGCSPTRTRASICSAPSTSSTPGLRWRSAALNRVVREAQELVLELDDAEMAAERARSDRADAARQVGAGAAAGVARPARRPRAACSPSCGSAEGSLDGLETWAVAVILGVGQMARDYVGEGETDLAAAAAALPGVEEVLTAEFRANGRPISGVETAADQIGAFRGMPPAVQQAMLDETVDAYARGDEAGDPDETDWIERQSRRHRRRDGGDAARIVRGSGDPPQPPLRRLAGGAARPARHGPVRGRRRPSRRPGLGPVDAREPGTRR